MKIKNRFREPSTYAGIAGLLASIGVIVGPSAAEKINPIAQAVAEGGGLIASGGTALGITAILGSILAIVLPEKGGEE